MVCNVRVPYRGRHRRLLQVELISILVLSSIALLSGSTCWASNVTYAYNSSGQLVELTYDNGTVVKYTYDANGNREAAQVLSPTLETPTNLQAKPVSESEIDLSWTGSTGATGYYIFWCQDSGCTPTQQLTTVSGTSYPDTGLSASTTYVYEVQAYQTTSSGSTVVSATSTTASATTDQDTEPPTAPSNLTAIASGTSISLTWIASADNEPVAGYDLWRCTGAGCSSFASIDGDISGTSYTNSGLPEDTTYQYEVRAFDGFGNYSGFSNVASATTPDTSPPTVPQNVSATAASWSTVDLSWSASTDDTSVAGYKVYRGGSQIGTSSTTSYTDSTTMPNTTYSYTVSAYDPAGNNSAQSSAASVTTPAGPTPSTPTGLSATVAGDNQVNLSWNPSSDAGGPGIGGYKIYRDGTQIGASTSTSFSDGGVATFNTYTYTVAAYDKGGTTSAQSTAVSASTFYQITNSSGSSISSLYSSGVTVYSTRPVMEYYWHVNQAYGSDSVVLESGSYPSSSIATLCQDTGTVTIASGYERSGCIVEAAPSVYGH